MSVLAIGIDAAEPTLVRGLIDRGELPALRRLLEAGTWSRVTSPASIGSSAVWPTFITGAEPAVHGIYGEWPWRPEAMRIDSAPTRDLTPFWREADRRGATVGVLDVPLAPTIGLARGFELSEWGAHDTPSGRTEIGPPSLEATVRRLGAHPFAARRPEAAGSDDWDAVAGLSALCLAGVQLRGRLAARLLEEIRPDLAIIVFPEIHGAQHHLWHTVAPEHPFYAGGRHVRPGGPSLIEILREVDRQIGRLVEIVGSDAAVLVFSLHGMQPTRGVVTLLGPVLRATGFARASGWRSQSWRERARSVFAAAKRRTPQRLKTLYYRILSRGLTHRLAQTTMLPSYDWRHTRAFALPTDQHGWVRVNLAGREAQGIVAPERYEATCHELETLLRVLTTADGRPVVRDVIGLAREHGGAPPPRLPDLVVHWHDAAFDDPVRLRQPTLTARPTGLRYTGQHAPDGFCLARGVDGVGACVAAEDLHRLILAATTPPVTAP